MGVFYVKTGYSYYLLCGSDRHWPVLPQHATDVNGFVLGGRSVGPWLTAFAYGTSYFSAVVFVGYAGQFGWKYGLPQPGLVSATQL